MSDIGLILENNCFDLKIENDDLVADNGLETSVSISLFTDKRVTDEQLPIYETNKRGWWGDMFPDEDQDQIGSRLWTTYRAKVITESLRRTEELCKESLDWMKEDGIASEIGVISEYNENKHMVTTIKITKPSGDLEKFSAVWDEQGIKELRRL